jgi:hypothetical protein
MKPFFYFRKFEYWTKDIRVHDNPTVFTFPGKKHLIKYFIECFFPFQFTPHGVQADELYSCKLTVQQLQYISLFCCTRRTATNFSSFQLLWLISFHNNGAFIDSSKQILNIIRKTILPGVMLIRHLTVFTRNLQQCTNLGTSVSSPINLLWKCNLIRAIRNVQNIEVNSTNG